jgi:hypothetical protein
MARGRPTEARQLAGRAVATDRAAIDALFAGMPRSVVWPADPVALPPSEVTLFDAAAFGTPLAAPVEPASFDRFDAIGSSPFGSVDVAPGEFGGASDTRPGQLGAGVGHEFPGQPVASSIGLWELADVDAADVTTGGADAGSPDPIDVLAAGRRAILDGRRAAAAVPLALALRLDSTLAQAVVDLLTGGGDPGLGEPTLALVRGDAYRLLGREADARRAYAQAVADTGIGTDRTDTSPDATDTSPQEGDPA